MLHALMGWASLCRATQHDLGLWVAKCWCHSAPQSPCTTGVAPDQSADSTLRCDHRPQAQLLRCSYAHAQLSGALGSCGSSRVLCYSEEHFKQLEPAALQQLDQPAHEEALLRALLGTVLVVSGTLAGDAAGAAACTTAGASQQVALLRQLQEQQLVAAAMDEARGRRLLPVARSSAIELAVAPEVRLGLWQHLQLLAARLGMQVQVLVQREGRSGSAAGAATWVVVEPEGAGEHEPQLHAGL
jgi:hypothetical protein